MNTIKSKVEILPLPEPDDRMGVMMHLEKIGRVCYKSEDRITNESCVKFIKTLRDNKHWAMLEHYTFVMAIDFDTFLDLASPDRYCINNYKLNHAMRFINITSAYDSSSNDNNIESCKAEHRYIVSGSATAFNYLYEAVKYDNGANNDLCKQIKDICQFLASHHPELMNYQREEYELIDYNIHFLSRQEIANLPNPLRIIHDSMSVKFTVDRGVTHELVRHRPCSWAQESTRYCNYGNNKYGRSINVIDPFFFEKEEQGVFKTFVKKIPIIGNKLFQTQRDCWERACKVAERAYLKLLTLGAIPQEARSVLPQSTKAEIIMTASLGEMRHFFKMRVANTAHPQMREVTVPLFIQTKSEYAPVFDDMTYCRESGTFKYEEE